MIWLAPPWGLYFNPWKVSLVEAEIGRNYLMMSVWSRWKETCAGSAVPAELGEVPMSEGRHFSLAEGRTELFLLQWVPADALGWLSEADTEHLWKSHHQEGEQALPSSPWADLQPIRQPRWFAALWIQKRIPSPWFVVPPSQVFPCLFPFPSPGQHPGLPKPFSTANPRGCPSPTASNSTFLWLLHHPFVQRSFWTDWRHSRAGLEQGLGSLGRSKCSLSFPAQSWHCLL